MSQNIYQNLQKISFTNKEYTGRKKIVRDKNLRLKKSSKMFQKINKQKNWKIPTELASEKNVMTLNHISK